MTQLLKELQRDYESDQYENHRKLAISIEDVVLGHLRLQMLGEKSAFALTRAPRRGRIASCPRTAAACMLLPKR